MKTGWQRTVVRPAPHGTGEPVRGLERGSRTGGQAPCAFRDQQSGFTLVELMIVVGIIAIIMAIGIPAFVQARNKSPMRQTVSELKEVFARARAQAILSGRMVELRIRPLDAVFDVPPLAGIAGAAAVTGAGTGAMSVTLPPEISIELLDVNLQPFKDAEEAVVRFHANGTCDLFTVVLRAMDNEFCMLWLELTTSLAHVEHDPQKFQQAAMKSR